jgi:hypothetical protein
MVKKIIELKADGLGLLVDNEPFLIPDDLCLNFISKSYDLTNAFISLKNGKEEGQYKLKKEFNVPEQFLIGGKLEITVRIYHGSSFVKTWAIIPIKMVETEFGIHAFDFLEELDQRYQQVCKKLNEVIEKHNALEEHVSELKENY